MRPARALAPLGGALIAWAAFDGLLRLQRVADPFRGYGGSNANVQPVGEGTFFLAVGVLGTLAALWLGAAAARTIAPGLARLEERAARRLRTSVLVLSVGAVLLAALLGASFWHQRFTDDEAAYLFATKLLRHGHLSAPAFEPSDAFHYQFLPVFRGRQFGMYGLVQAALLLPGLLLGLPPLGPHLLVGVVVCATAGIAYELCGARTAVRAGVLAALSPFLLFTGATLHNATTSTALLASFLWLFLRHERRLRVAEALGAGLCLGAAMHVRMLDALACTAPAACLALGRLLFGPHRRARILGYGALASGAILGLGTYLLLNAHLCGDWLPTPYELFNRRFPGARMFGFGKAPFRMTSTPEMAFSRLCVQLARADFWMIGGALGVLPALAARGRGALLLGAVAASVVGGYFFYFANSVHDTGPVYLLCALPAAAVLAARGLGTLGALAPGAPACALAALVVAGGAFFVPRELVAAREVARLVRRPTRAVERAGLHQAVVLVRTVQARQPVRSWVFVPEPPDPYAPEDVIYVTDTGPRAGLLRPLFPGRQLVRLVWHGELPVLEPVPEGPPPSAGPGP